MSFPTDTKDPECNIDHGALADDEKSTPDKELIEILVSTTYRLYFNPRVPGLGKTKLMRFGAGGDILEGQNKNETTWTIRYNQLELVNSEGNVHSRFYYSANDRRFFHTNDPDTMSVQQHGIGDQYMVPEDAEKGRSTE